MKNTLAPSGAGVRGNAALPADAGSATGTAGSTGAGSFPQAASKVSRQDNDANR